MKHHLLENVRIVAGENDGIAFQRQSLTYNPLYVRECTALASGARGAGGICSTFTIPKPNCPLQYQPLQELLL